MSGISKYIQYYPSDTTNVAFEMLRRKEFEALGPTEKMPDAVGIPLKHQQNTSRYISPHTLSKTQLIVHAVGTGKTCVISFIQEHFRQFLKGNAKRALVILKNKTLIRQFEHDVATRCTSNIYTSTVLTEDEDKEDVVVTEKAKAGRIRRELKKSYETTTLQAFFRRKIDPRKYDGRNIFIDEVHTISNPENTKQGVYKNAHKFLHGVKNCRIIALTATPVVDEAKEFGQIMNLLLPKNKQFDTENFDKYFEQSESGNIRMTKAFYKLLKGKVSYVRGMESSSKIIQMGISDLTEQTIIFPNVMSEYQSKRIEMIEAHGQKAVFDYSVFAFPDIKNSKIRNDVTDKLVEAEDYIDFDGKIPKFVTPDGIILRNAISSIEGLYKFSTIFASIVYQIREHPEENVFIYSDRRTGPGIEFLALVIKEILEFEWITDPNAIKPNGKTRQLITMTGSTTGIPQMLKKINTPEMAKAGLVILGTDKVGFGVTLYSIRQEHIIRPWWNMPKMVQALGRGNRFGSHRFLPEPDRYLKTFIHVNVHKGTKQAPKGMIYPPDEKFSTKETEIIRIMRDFVEKKDRYTMAIMRGLKRISWDCALNYGRNVLKTDINKSRNCDYKKCNYHCVGYNRDSPADILDKSGKVWKYKVPEDKIISNNYNLFYAGKEKELYKREIKSFFKSYFLLSLDEIIEMMKLEDEGIDVLMGALFEMIGNREPILDRYGFTCYLKEKNNTYFLSSNYSINVDISSHIYMKEPISVEKRSLDDVLTLMQLKDDQENVKKFIENPTEKTLLAISWDTIIMLFEKILIDKSISKKPPGKFLLNKYKKYTSTVDGSIVHWLYSATKETIDNKIITADGNLRILYSGAGHFVFVGSRGKEAKLVSMIKKQQDENIEWDGIYNVRGLIRNGKFKIQMKPTTIRRKGGGMVCNTYSIDALMEIMVDLQRKAIKNDDVGPLGSASDISNIKAEMNDIKHHIKSNKISVEKFDDTDMKYVYNFINLHNKKSQMCKQLMKWFKQRGLFEE